MTGPSTRTVPIPDTLSDLWLVPLICGWPPAGARKENARMVAELFSVHKQGVLRRTTPNRWQQNINLLDDRVLTVNEVLHHDGVLHSDGVVHHV